MRIFNFPLKFIPMCIQGFALLLGVFLASRLPVANSELAETYFLSMALIQMGLLFASPITNLVIVTRAARYQSQLFAVMMLNGILSAVLIALWVEEFAVAAYVGASLIILTLSLFRRACLISMGMDFLSYFYQAIRSLMIPVLALILLILAEREFFDLALLLTLIAIFLLPQLARNLSAPDYVSIIKTERSAVFLSVGNVLIFAIFQLPKIVYSDDGESTLLFTFVQSSIFASAALSVFESQSTYFLRDIYKSGVVKLRVFSTIVITYFTLVILVLFFLTSYFGTYFQSIFPFFNFGIFLLITIVSIGITLCFQINREILVRADERVVFIRMVPLVLMVLVAQLFFQEAFMSNAISVFALGGYLMWAKYDPQ